VHGRPFKADDLIAYFCAEFGFHESLPIYSGGLGILAGDHCKAPATWACPSSVSACFTARAISSRRWPPTGISRHLQRLRFRRPADFPGAQRDGNEVLVAGRLPRRTVQAKLWEVKVGHVKPHPARHLAAAKHRIRPRNHPPLYGGDKTPASNRKSCSASAAHAPSLPIGLKPTVWHVNEGHAAFLILERIRSLVAAAALCRGARSGGIQRRVHHAYPGAGRP
jgi:starch phosphorylase